MTKGDSRSPSGQRSKTDLYPPLAERNAGICQSRVVPETWGRTNLIRTGTERLIETSGETTVDPTDLLRFDRRHSRCEHPAVPVHLV